MINQTGVRLSKFNTPTECNEPYTYYAAIVGAGIYYSI
jgi:hypothetical protein